MREFWNSRSRALGTPFSQRARLRQNCATLPRGMRSPQQLHAPMGLAGTVDQPIAAHESHVRGVGWKGSAPRARAKAQPGEVGLLSSCRMIERLEKAPCL